jgi:hypothetical protein
MRLWTFHPKYLDVKGLAAVWRESLLAQKVLDGKTKGYRFHPQLIRFRMQRDPIGSIGAYCYDIYREARLRGYYFDLTKILCPDYSDLMQETLNQMLLEWQHYLRKINVRSPMLYKKYILIQYPEPHPLFKIIEGAARDWEKLTK